MKKMYRSNDNKYVAGIFGGMGEYFNMDPMPFRLIALLIFIASPFWFTVIYFISAFFIPANPNEYSYEYYKKEKDFDKNTDTYEYTEFEDDYPENQSKASLIFGLGLIFYGVIKLLYQFVPGFRFNFIPTLQRFIRSIGRFWPILPIILGFYIIFNRDND